jgi:hypothetical protein
MRARICLAFAAYILTHSFVIFRVEAARYAFTNIVDNATPAPNGQPFTVALTPSISGDMAAFLGYFQGFSNHALFTGNGVLLQAAVSRGDAAPEGTFTTIRDPAISGETTAFVGHYGNNKQGVFTQNGGVVNTIAKTGDPTPLAPLVSFDSCCDGQQQYPFPAISGDTVAFRGIIGFDQEGIFTGNGGPLTTIVKTGDTAPTGTFRIFGEPSISGDTVAFRSKSVRSSGIYSGNGGPLTTIAKYADPAPEGTFTFFGDPTISGENVVFTAEYGSDMQGIFTGNGGPLTTILKTGDPAPSGTFLHFGLSFPTSSYISPAIAGDMIAFDAYYGVTPNQFHGIFVSQNGAVSPAIKVGDPLFGSIVRGVAVSKFGLDPEGSGNLVFNYRLEDMRQGIAVARLVPEPSSMLLVLLIISSFAGLRGATTIPGRGVCRPTGLPGRQECGLSSIR